ncbi:hypothetical protein B9Z19DRAFT_293915 [Tuber borchii]|uniref:Uncharacterized protein n=1 Tax=Tuber borchii TaxID=42251 RepID=A0A2T6ZKF6_TUBBO|nr:hypothetical protein B9Z19DRAFT_293915 [Tuber borchii]
MTTHSTHNTGPQHLPFLDSENQDCFTSPIEDIPEDEETSVLDHSPIPLDVPPGLEPDGYKWILRSSTAVEDILLRGVLEKKISTFPSGLMVLDISDSLVKCLFEPEDWAEITGNVPALPSRDPILLNFLKNFISVTSTKALRDLLFKSYLPEGVAEYDRALHYDLAWAHGFMSKFLLYADHPDDPLRGSHQEDWYTARIWSPIIDDCFLGLEKIGVEHSELCLQATSQRENIDKVKRRKIENGCTVRRNNSHKWQKLFRIWGNGSRENLYWRVNFKQMDWGLVKAHSRHA